MGGWGRGSHVPVNLARRPPHLAELPDAYHLKRSTCYVRGFQDSTRLSQTEWLAAAGASPKNGERCCSPRRRLLGAA